MAHPSHQPAISAASAGQSDGASGARELRRLIETPKSVLFAYSCDSFIVTGGDSGIKLMPLKGHVTSRQFFGSLSDNCRGINTLSVLRLNLCTDFLREIERIYQGYGIKLVICYDVVDQIFRSGSSNIVNHRGLRIKKVHHHFSNDGYHGPVERSHNRDNTGVGKYFSLYDFAREWIDKYPEGHPSWLIAIDALQEHELKLQPYVIARAIRDIRKKEGEMPGLPMLHEFVDWVIKENEWEIKDDPDYSRLEYLCSEHVPEGGYFNSRSLGRAVDFIYQSQVQTSH